MALLADDSLTDPALFARVWEFLPSDAARPGALLLIVSLVLMLLCQWHMRFIQPCSSNPRLFLLVVEHPADVVDVRRQNWAADLLAASPSALQSDPFDGFTFKAREAFKAELQVLAATGRCPTALYNFCLAVRAGLADNTQDVEGLNSILQALVTRGRRTEQASADARMALRVGDELEASALSDMHGRTCAHIDTDAHITRYTTCAGEPGPDVPEPFVAPEPPPPDQPTLLACAFALDARRHISIGARHAIFFDRCAAGPCFLAPFSYYAAVFTVTATATLDFPDTDDDSMTLVLDCPIVPTTLGALFRDTALCSAGGPLYEMEPPRVGRRRLRRVPKRFPLSRAPLVWETGLRAHIDAAHVENFTCESFAIKALKKS